MIKFKKLRDDAIIPTRATDGSAGFDLYCVGSTFYVDSFGGVSIGTGIAVQFMNSFVGLIKPRSSLAMKGIDVLGGVIDSDYRGEIKVILANHSPTDLKINHGDRIAQLVVTYCETDFTVVDELDDTERGLGGFGSTGK